MKHFCYSRIMLLPVIFIVFGCAVETSRRPPEPAISKVISGPGNQYYYFTAAEIQRVKGNLDKAIVLLRRAVELDPDSLYLQRELATVYLQNKENQRALEVLENLLAKNPNDVKSLIIYGGIRQVRKENQQAVAAYEKALTQDPKQEKVYSLLGALYLQADDFKRAREVFNRQVEVFPSALELVPDRLEPRFQLVDLYKTQGRTGDVIRMYEDILHKYPSNIRAAMELGFYYHQQERNQQAAHILTRLGQRSVSEFEVVVTAIQLYLDQKKFKDALVVINGMLEGAPDNPDIHHLAGIAYYGLKDNAKAVAHFEQVTAQSRFFQDAVVHVAYIYQDEKKNDQGIKYLQSAVEKDPDNSDFKYYLGTFYEEIEDYENAERYIQEAISLEPDNSRYYFRLGVIYDKQNKKGASMAAMRKVIELDPKHANALNYIGYTYADLGKNLDEAERLIKEALKYKPNDGYITDSLGWVFYKKGDFKTALKYLRKAVKLVPDDPTMLEHLGDAYLKLNDKSNALKFYKKSLKVKEKDKEALQEKIRHLQTNGS